MDDADLLDDEYRSYDRLVVPPRDAEVEHRGDGCLVRGCRYVYQTTGCGEECQGKESCCL